MAIPNQPAATENPPPRRIVLTGFMGSGKSTVGPLVAARLGWSFLDVDDVIEAEAGCTIAELFTRAKAKPDEFNYASPGAGTTPHLSGELLKIVGGVEITHVPFSGAGPAIQALLGGVTQLAVTALPPAIPYIESGAIKALAVTGARRWIDLPNVPTMVELGYNDFIAETFQAFMAPVKTPREIVERLSAKSVEALKKPDVVEQLRVNGFEVIANGSDGLRQRIETEVPKWRNVIAKAGIKPV